MTEDQIRRDNLAEKLQVEVMEDYIRDASELDRGIIKNTYLREHFTKLVDWIIEREDQLKDSFTLKEEKSYEAIEDNYNLGVNHGLENK